MRVRIAAAIGVAAWVAAAAAQAPQGPVFRSDAELVEIDVVVGDQDGRFVADLTAGDITVVDAGTAHPIQQFYLAGSSSIPVTGAAAPRLLEPDAGGARGGRIFVVLFDEAHLSLSGFKRTQAAAMTLFERQFRAGDLGGVVIRGRMVKDRLTSDRNELLAAVKSARPDSTKNSRLAFEHEYPRLSETEAVRIVITNDRVVIDEAMRRACADEPDLCERVDP
jgi:VWFA-related protein